MKKYILIFVLLITSLITRSQTIITANQSWYTYSYSTQSSPFAPTSTPTTVTTNINTSRDIFIMCSYTITGLDREIFNPVATSNGTTGPFMTTPNGTFTVVRTASSLTQVLSYTTPVSSSRAYKYQYTPNANFVGRDVFPVYIAVWQQNLTSNTIYNSASPYELAGTITVDVGPVTNKELLSLSSNRGAISPGFVSSITNYTVTLPAGSTGTATLTPTVKYSNFQTTTITSATNVAANNGVNNVAKVVLKNNIFNTFSTYTVTYLVTTPLSSITTLTSLSTGVGTLTPSYSASITTYTITLPYLTTLPTTLTTANFNYGLPTGATISSYTSAVLTTTSSISTLSFIVKAENNTTTKTYRIIYKLASPDNNANLATLTTSQGVLSPTFSPNIQIYSVVLPFGETMDNNLLIATTQSSVATITTNIISGNSKVVAVKAQAGNTKSYRVDYSNAPDPTLSVHENSFNETVVYPNPTKDKLFIKSEHAIKKVLIYDNNGKVVVKQSTQEVDIKHLPAGVYYIEINQNKNKIKIIKE